LTTDLELATKHKYKLMSGEVGINVTAVTGLLDDEGKSSRMAGAAAKLTREGQNYRQVWKSKMERGTRIHGHCEAWLRGENVNVIRDDQPFMDGLAKFFYDLKPQPVEIERVVLSHLGYGGRFDSILRFPTGEQWLVDLKSGSPHFVEHSCQLAAYAKADGMARYDREGQLMGLEPLPRIDYAGCLYLTEDGDYTLTEYPVERAWPIFTHLLDVYKGLVDLKAAANA